MFIFTWIDRNLQNNICGNIDEMLSLIKIFENAKIHFMISDKEGVRQYISSEKQSEYKYWLLDIIAFPR